MKNRYFYPELAAAILLTGCTAVKPTPETWLDEPAQVTHVAEPIQFDGVPDEAVWQQTPAYPLHQVRYGASPRELARIGKDSFEPGTVRFLYDDQYLYVGCVLEDADIFNDCAQDQTRLFRYGDLLEFFIMPEDANRYWELYAAPNGAKSSFFYPGCSFGPIESVFEENPARLMPGFEVKVKVNGSLNNHADCDQNWSVEMRVPLAELQKFGVPFAPDTRWRLLVARYNYGTNLYLKQGSSFPKLPCPGYNQCQYFSPVKFQTRQGCVK